MKKTIICVVISIAVCALALLASPMNKSSPSGGFESSSGSTENFDFSTK